MACYFPVYSFTPEARPQRLAKSGTQLARKKWIAPSPHTCDGRDTTLQNKSCAFSSGRQHENIQLAVDVQCEPQNSAGHDNGDVHLWDMGSGSSQLLRQHSNTVTAVLVVLLKRNEELLITSKYYACPQIVQVHDSKLLTARVETPYSQEGVTGPVLGVTL
eukprot:1153589-Pelagomonas_calceolata.AAC.1